MHYNMEIDLEFEAFCGLVLFFQEMFPFFFYRLPALYNSVEYQSNFNLQVSVV